MSKTLTLGDLYREVGHMACREGREWLDRMMIVNPDAPLKELWARCSRGEWLVWLCDCITVPPKYMNRLAAALAASNLPLLEGTPLYDAYAEYIEAYAVWAWGGARKPPARLEKLDWALTPEEVADLVREMIPWQVMARALRRYMEESDA